MNTKLGNYISFKFYDHQLKNSKYVNNDYKNPKYNIINYSLVFIYFKGKYIVDNKLNGSCNNEEEIKFLEAFINKFKYRKDLIFNEFYNVTYGIATLYLAQTNKFDFNLDDPEITLIINTIDSL